MSKWIKIEEGCEMPPPGQDVLVYAHGLMMRGYYITAQGWVVEGDLPHEHNETVSHWMPLPAPPFEDTDS